MPGVGLEELVEVDLELEELVEIVGVVLWVLEEAVTSGSSLSVLRPSNLFLTAIGVKSDSVAGFGVGRPRASVLPTVLKVTHPRRSSSSSTIPARPPGALPPGLFLHCDAM